MKSLSKEIFLTIISHLDSRQKIKCVLVCKQWEQWIRNTILYQDVNLYTYQRFIEGIQLFEDNKNYSKQVQKLRMWNCEPDTYYMLSLPEIFVNLKKLIWISDHPSEAKFPRKPIYIQQLQNWNALEDISCFSKDYNHIALYLLESSVLPRLTTLEIQIVKSAPPTLYTRNLITCLKNAPALTKLTLGNISASISDLNTIHANAPSLQALYLHDLFLESLDAPNTSTVPSKLVCFSLRLRVREYMDMEEKNKTKTIRTLLSYVGNKYPILQKLSLRFGEERGNIFANELESIGPIESDILRTIRKLPSLTSYSIRFFPITDMIMEAMDDTSVKLEGIHIWLRELDTRRQFNFLLYSKQINYISELTITDTNILTRTLSNNLLIFNLVTNLSHLTVLNLHTQPGITTYSYRFLIKIISQLNNLDSLLIRSIYDDLEELAVELDTYQPKRSKLTHLDLQVTGTEHCGFYTNALFKFIFQSCPALKTFELRGELFFDRFTRLSLDLSHNRLLDDIVIGLSDVAFYTFDKKRPRVMYARRGIKLKVSHLETVKSTFYVELLCNKRTNISMLIAFTDEMSNGVYGTDDSTDTESD